MTQDYRSRFAQKMTDEQKQIFADKVFEAKKNDPSIKWYAALNAGRAAFPDIYIFPDNIINPASYPWLMRELKNRCAQTGHDIFAKSKRTKLTTRKIVLKTNSKEDLQNQVAQIVHEIRAANLKSTWSEVFALANEKLAGTYVFTKSRDSLGQMRWLKIKLAELDIKNSLAEQKVQNEPVVQASETLPEETSELPLKTEAKSDYEPSPEPVPETNGMMSLESALIQAIVSTVKPIVLNIINSPQFSNSLITAFREFQPMQTESSHPIVAEILKPVLKDAKPRVLIVGLINQQAQEIQKEWGRIYDLRIYDSDVTSEKIRSILPHCDKAILMTKFVSHRAQDAMRGCSGFTYCNGGVSALKELLSQRNGH